MKYQEYLEFAKSLASKADRIMVHYFDNVGELELKDDDTIVTVADKEINQMVIDEVKQAFPDHSVDGEEASNDNRSNRVWVCDPIDGTNPFAMGLPISVFSLALVIDGKPVVGVISDPFGKKLYSAKLGSGAFMNNQAISVSISGFENKVRVNFDWWSNAEYPVLERLVKLSEETGAYLLSPGSTTHMSALVARGDFVASVFSGTKGKNVDIAAAKIIVEEAGGKVTDLYGEEQRYDRDIKGAIVSNGVVHDQIVKALNFKQQK